VDLNRERKLRRLLGDSFKMNESLRRNPGPPGELVGIVDTDLFGQGFDLVYHFPESPPRE
jgi:hypothetical protein